METKLMVTQKEIHELAKSKGWWPRPFGESIALLHSELSEALEEWRDGNGFDEIYYTNFFGKRSYPQSAESKPEGIPIEMADFAIRLMDVAESEHISLLPHYCNGKKISKDFPSAIADLHESVSDLYRGYHSQDINEKYLRCREVDNMTKKTCHAFKIPLFRAINLKHSFNQTRAFRHGGKLA